jgi:pseudouridine-5'-phosphate glycosidase
VGLPLRLSGEVSDALAARRPVVAFETTILTFGLPQPLNAEVAARCEKIAREAGAIPATVALLNGEMRVGLTAQELDFFCSRDSGIQKVNLQNFAAVLHRRQPGALTVAASMQVCAAAGIRVFATGGIGGVHRDFGRLPDISSDLLALSRYPVATVCAGAKSILDVGATLEALETLGVPVAGYRARQFPLFHAQESGYPLDVYFESAADLARFAALQWQLSKSAVLVVTPVPAAKAIERADLDEWITSALARARDENISGKATTPFLLKQLEQLSNGRTLDANLALIYNNARVAAELAHELAQISRT